MNYYRKYIIKKTMKNKLSELYLIAVISVMCITGCKEEENVWVKNIAFDKTEITLSVGEYEDIIASIAPDDAVNKILTWKSSNAAIATVDNNGKVIAVEEGTVIITAESVNEVMASCTVTVTSKAVLVTDISIDEFAIVLAVGVKETLTATVIPDDATNKKTTWSSNNAEVATVNGEGEVVAIKEGVATITATSEDGDKTATCEVIVTASFSTEKPNDGIKVEIQATRMRIVDGMYNIRDIWWRANPKDVIVNYNYPTLQWVNTFFGYTDSDGSVLLCEVINYPDFDFIKQWEGEFVHNTGLGTVTEINIQISGVVRIYTDENGQKIGTMELTSLKRIVPDIEKPVLQLGTYSETYPNLGVSKSKIEFVDSETMKITEHGGTPYMHKYEIRGNYIIFTSETSKSELFFHVIDNSTFELEYISGYIATLPGWPIMTFERDDNQ
jgi:uncharacterized protein YjdB